MQLTQTDAERRIANLGMKDLPLLSYNRPMPQRIEPDWFSQYRKIVREFMTTLTDSIETLAFMNLSQDEFMGLITGRKMPHNLSVRMRIPLTLGGKIETSNLFLCRTFPHSQKMDIFIMSQSDANTIWLPNPAQKIYLPTNMGGGGEGGNATEDRLSQMAAQIAAERGME